MLGATLTPRRKVALALALAWWVPSFGYCLHSVHVGTGLPMLHWPFAVTVAWTLASALAAGALIVELARLSVRSSVSWSDPRHFTLALLVALVCFIVQWISLALASQRSDGRASEIAVNVTVCDLQKDPSAYDHKLVRVTGNVSFALEEFTLRPDVVMSEQRLREVEGLAHTLLSQSVSITPYQLAHRARINWFNARDVLHGLVRKGHLVPLLNGCFGRIEEPPKPSNGNSRRQTLER